MLSVFLFISKVFSGAEVRIPQKVFPQFKSTVRSNVPLTAIVFVVIIIYSPYIILFCNTVVLKILINPFKASTRCPKMKS